MQMSIPLPATSDAVCAPPGPPTPAAFLELVTQHRTRLYRFVLRHIGQACEAEDLAQQAFVEAARTFHTYRGESQLSSWLYGIALNLVRNHLSRAPQRRYRFEDDSTLGDLHDPQPSPEQSLELRQMVDTLDRAMADLLPDMREVLTLVALEEMSYEEAAELLVIPVGTVRSRVSRARARLRQRLEDDGIALPF